MMSWDQVEHGRQLSSREEIKRSKHVRIGEKLKPWKGEVPETEDWARLGRPEIWVIQDEYKGWTLYQDLAYGTLALTAWGNQRIVKHLAMNFVCNEDSTIIGLGPYHLGDKCRIFVRATKVMTDK